MTHALHTANAELAQFIPEPAPKSRKARQREALRVRLYAAQGGACSLCGEQMSLNRGDSPDTPRLYATFDHQIPKCMGGRNSKGNLKLAHLQCNFRRGGKPLNGPTPPSKIQLPNTVRNPRPAVQHRVGLFALDYTPC